MKVLVIGGGGREHALAWALRKSPAVSEIVCAPGNAGIAEIARCEPLDVADVKATTALVEREHPELVVVGPEIPLAAGVVDALQERGVQVFGPTRAAARLETSKGFAKEFMRRWQIPTAKYEVCRSADEVAKALKAFPPAVVVKADGLAAGKGVVLCESHQEAQATAEAMFSGGLLGSPVPSLVLEETLTGPEVSFFALCDGTRALPMAVAQDHKRIGEGDTGPNTGGMGAYSSDDLLSPELFRVIESEVAQRVVDGMRAEGNPFVGVLFIGLMLTPDGPKVLEFNTRFGDPETEAILMRLQSDLPALFGAAIEGRLEGMRVELTSGSSACVIAASAGYPGKVETGVPISGAEVRLPGVEVFHAGTRRDADGRLLTAGGRVLAVSAAGTDLRDALRKAYGALEKIEFPGMQYRRDIGWRALS